MSAHMSKTYRLSYYHRHDRHGHHHCHSHHLRQSIITFIIIQHPSSILHPPSSILIVIYTQTYRHTYRHAYAHTYRVNGLVTVYKNAFFRRYRRPSADCSAHCAVPSSCYRPATVFSVFVGIDRSLFPNSKPWAVV